jgi:predicted tellurium resistance membrane protein TerC
MSLDWVAPLLTLTAMEIVLGIDNIIFLAIIAGRLPPEQQPKARRLGLLLALGTRLLLLFTLTWLMGLKEALFTLPEMPFFETTEAREVSLKDLILFVGGLFLIYKSTHEIHAKLEGEEDELTAAGPAAPKAGPSFVSVLIQIALIDIIFSLDSVITAVGMARPDQLWVMVVAMICAVGVMLFAAGAISDFVNRHPTLKMLALSFLILIGVVLMADGLGQHLNKGYIYFAMAFSVVVEMLNLRLRKSRKPVELHGKRMPAP